MMDGRTGGRRDGGVGGSRGNWQAWLRFLFSFNSSFAHTSSDAGKSNLSSPSSPLRLPVFLPRPLNHSPAGPSFAHAVSGCLFAWLCLCLFCVCTTNTHMQKPQDLDQFPVEKRGVSLCQNIWKWAFCSRQSLHSDLIILSCWCMCVCYCLVCACKTQIRHFGFIYTTTRW